MSGWLEPSFGTRLSAWLVNTTKRPSSEIEGSKLAPTACAPPVATLTRTVELFHRSRTKTSPAAFESPATRLPAELSNATQRASALRSGRPPPPAGWPIELTLTQVVLQFQ